MYEIDEKITMLDDIDNHNYEYCNFLNKEIIKNIKLSLAIRLMLKQKQGIYTLILLISA